MDMAGSEICEIKLDVKEEDIETIVPDCGSPLPQYGSLEPKYEALRHVPAPVEEEEVEENPILAGYLFKANPCGTRDHCSALVQNLRKELTEALTKLKVEQKRNHRLQSRNNELERKNKYLQQCLDMQRAKKNYKHFKTEQQMIGGGPPPTTTDAISSKVLEIVREELKPVENYFDIDAGLQNKDYSIVTEDQDDPPPMQLQGPHVLVSIDGPATTKNRETITPVKPITSATTQQTLKTQSNSKQTAIEPNITHKKLKGKGCEGIVNTQTAACVEKFYDFKMQQETEYHEWKMECLRKEIAQKTELFKREMECQDQKLAMLKVKQLYWEKKLKEN